MFRDLRSLIALPDYLWGIETIDGAVRVDQSCQASRLPMRNWNWGGPENGPTPFQNRFQTTYEELKPFLVCNGVRLARLPDYLWGIETGYRFQKTYHWNLLPDYLWGIETEFPAGIVGSVGSFQTTYEELKLSIGLWLTVDCMLPDYLWGIETNVKNIVDMALPRLPDYLWGIETGFGNRMFLDNSTQASRLPMRNWNAQVTDFSLGSDTKLPDYLWGIETFSSFSFYFCFCFASRLPMRNWNRACVLDYWRWHYGFQTTYEELKLSLFSEHPVNLIWLPDYLWGIETCPPGRRAYFWHASRLPMRNWNSKNLASSLL